MIIEDYNEPLIRQDVNDFGRNTSHAPAICAEIVDYMDGNSAYWIKKSMAERFAIRFEKRKSPKGDDEVIQIKDEIAVAAAIQSNMQEVASLGTFKKIVQEISNLNRGTSFKYVDQNGNESEEVEEKISGLREDANFGLSLGRLDDLAVGVGSSLMLIQVLGNSLFYSPISRNNVFVVFPDEVYEGSGVSGRAVNTLDVQEAAVVVIRLTSGSFVAYFGRSLNYPNGRMVMYESKSWDSIPAVGEKNSSEYVDENGEIANPLTAYQDTIGDYNLPEYPVVIWKGSAVAFGKSLMPVTPSLYNESLEQDVATSRCLTAALKSARGAWHISREPGSGDGIPANIDEGFNSLPVGHSVGVLQVPGDNIRTAVETTEKLSAYTAESYGVPAYKLSVSQNANIPSGAALAELNKPSALVRQTRYELNRSSMDTIFQIEKALISIETGEEFGPGVEQTWIVPPEQITKTNTELYTEAKLAEEAGVKDKIQNIIDIIEGVETREEAEEYLNSLTPAPVEPVSGLAGFAQRAARNATQ